MFKKQSNLTLTDPGTTELFLNSAHQLSIWKGPDNPKSCPCPRLAVAKWLWPGIRWKAHNHMGSGMARLG